MRLAIIVATLLLAPSAFAGDLTVTFEGVRNGQGKLSVGLFRETDGWPDGKTFLSVDLKPEPGAVTYTFKDLPPGYYAISAFHDENSNGKFDRSFFGLPKEGFAFSNDVQPGLDAPSFRASSFEVSYGPATAHIHMRYWASSR